MFYTGKINSIHDVRGKDGVGAKMDSMELEREKGITIQSAATFCQWKGGHMNIIDTPGHVDFTIEVERALRVLDGAVFVLCGVSGVQSQSITVDRQMKRYEIPRICFINKLDRSGSNPFKVIDDLRSQLKINAAAIQVPIGLEDKHIGVVDLLTMDTMIFSGANGEDITIKPLGETDDLPEETVDLANSKRLELIEMLAEVDDEVAELFLMEEEITGNILKDAVRRQTIAKTFVPVFMGSAFKNKGVQPLLDGVFDYLPSPSERTNSALDIDKNEEKVDISNDPKDDLLALAFKLEETQFGQLTYMRVYRGTIQKGQMIKNVATQKRQKVPRIVRMHSNEMEDVASAEAGEVVATFGIDSASMDTFASIDSKDNLALSSMFVPEPVMSLSVRPKDRTQIDKFGKALNKFTREDPTLRVKIDDQTKETVISGMGELHLDVYVERMKREFDVDVVTGQPNVNYKETIHARAEFDYLHKKQSGGSGQYAKVIGYIEPMGDDEAANEFDNRVIGTNIPPEYLPSCAKGMNDAMLSGALVGCEVEGVRVVLEDGQSHAVDSSDMAFRICTAQAIRQAMNSARPSVLEPIMRVEIEVPMEFQGTVIAELTKRMGMIEQTDTSDDGSGVTISAMVPLSHMFGYSTQLRSMTQGKGEFTMEYEKHSPVSRDQQEDLIEAYKLEREGKDQKEAA